MSVVRNFVVDHLKAVGAEVGSSLEQALNRFADWVDDQQATNDAVNLLESKGYTVTPPASQA